MSIKTMLNYSKLESNASISEMAQLAKASLANDGYIIIRNFGKDTDDFDELKTKFRKICEEIGEPVPHDSRNTIVWDIKSNPESISFIKTYSEHNHEAELHTDSQYSYYPEDFFGLLTLKKANCGGGMSYLLSLNDILTSIRSDDNNQSLEETLRNEKFPFIVPNIFKKDSSEGREYNFGPILAPDEIRFRVDTFEKAIAENPEFCTPKQIEAYQMLKSMILNSDKIKRFYLEDRDLLFINNKTMLHGRSSFTDSNRHLLRIRMNKKGVQTTFQGMKK
jgi:alpha-ketoglutarate-dependent taurine dioxygenase